jgi:TRAP-type C4-dicarboxylate transport system substrate-binding protein
LNVSVTEKQWAEKIKEMSGGRLEFQLYFSEALAKQTEVFKAVQTGVADIGYIVVGSDASQVPLSMMSRRVFTGLPSMKAAGPIRWELYNKNPEIRAEWKNMKALTFNGLPPDQFFLAKKEVRVPADMKGLKIIARGDYPEVMTACGASPVGLSVATGTLLLRKVWWKARSVSISWQLITQIAGFYKFFTMFGDGGTDITTEGHFINVDSWNKLPADLQKILLDSCKWYEEAQDKSTLEGYNDGVAAAKASGGKFVNLTEAEINQWRELTAPLDKKYIETHSSKGPAQAIYDDIRAFSKKYADVK